MGVTWPVVVGSVLIVGGIGLVLWVGADTETLHAIGAGLGIFGAAMILRTIGPRTVGWRVGHHHHDDDAL